MHVTCSFSEQVLKYATDIAQPIQDSCWHKQHDFHGGQRMQYLANSRYQSALLIGDQEDLSSTYRPGSDLCEAERAPTHTGQSVSAPRAQQDTPVRPLTAAQRAFVEGISRGETHKQAYRDAYPGDSSTDASISTSASRLLKDQRVQKALRDHQETDPELLLDDPEAMKRFVMVQLLRCARTFKQEGSKIKALELIGKAAGLFQPKPEREVTAVSAEQLRRELSAHLKLVDSHGLTSA